MSMQSKFREEKNNPPDKRKHRAQPQKHHTRNRPPIFPVLQPTPPVHVQIPLCRRLVHTRHIRALTRNQVRICQRTRKRKHTRQHTTNSPRNLHSSRFRALRPEQVEEKRAAKDGGDVDPDKDVERCDADKRIVVHVRSCMLCREEILLIDVVSRMGLAGWFWVGMGMGMGIAVTG